LTGVFWARDELTEPRPGYWSLRFMLIHDTVHAAHRLSGLDDGRRRDGIESGDVTGPPST
jgi:hypothetical protein